MEIAEQSLTGKRLGTDKYNVRSGTAEALKRRVIWYRYVNAADLCSATIRTAIGGCVAKNSGVPF